MTFPVLLGWTPAMLEEYADKVLATQSANLIAYWPLWEASGATADNYEGTAARDGAYTAVTLGQTGIGDGRTSSSFDGSTSFCNIYSASLNTAMSKTELTVAGWMKVSGVGDWSDATARSILTLSVDGANNFILLRKSSTTNYLGFYYVAGGTTELIQYLTSAPVGFVHVGLTVSKIADQVKAYVAGSQVGSTQTGLGTWVGDFLSTQTNIGSFTSGPSSAWKGLLAHVSLWSTPLSGPEILSLATV